MKITNRDFETVTELPGNKAHRDQIDAIRTRYCWAAERCENKDTLELACGSGIGLGILERASKSLIGGDVDPNVLDFAARHYLGRSIELKNIDACNICLPSQSVDVVICFEALYYFNSFSKALKEINRILRKKGEFLGCTVNKQWHGFNPSPYSTNYYSLDELSDLLHSFGFNTVFSLAYEDKPHGQVSRFVSWLRKKASELGLIPKTMKGKAFLKRLFYGRLSPLPAEMEAKGLLHEVEPIKENDIKTDYKVIFFHAKKI
jgi:ubiquinone/menaquinone biosynthesis C-methylase UbiE